MYNELYHFGILGMKWGVRRYQNKDGTLTPEGKRRYYNPDGTMTEHGRKAFISKDGTLTEAGRKRYRTYNGYGDLTKEGWLLYHNKDGSMTNAQKVGYFNECEGDERAKHDEYVEKFLYTKNGKKLRDAYDRAYEDHFETGKDKTGERFIKAEEDYLKAQYAYATEKMIDFYGERDISILTTRYLKAGGGNWERLQSTKDITINDINRSIEYFGGDRQKLANFYNTRVYNWEWHTE